jgi:hypothetical protein
MRALVAASLVALAACAGQPQQPAAPAAATASAGSGTASGQDLAGSKSSSSVPYGYTRVVRHGTEYFCHKENVTGSRMEKHETCLTQAQIDAQRAAGVDFTEQVQGMGTRTPPTSTPGQGGAGMY